MTIITQVSKGKKPEHIKCNLQQILGTACSAIHCNQ